MAESCSTQRPHLPHEISTAREFLHTRRRSALIRLISHAAESANKEPAEFRVLDVGCGRGELMRDLADRGYQVQGIDIDPVCASLSLRYGPCIQATAAEIPKLFQAQGFDVVVASHVLEHTLDPLETIACFQHASRRWIVLAVPNPLRPQVILRHLQRRLYSSPTHVVAWDRSHFHHFLTLHAGLEVVCWDTDHIQILGRGVQRRARRLSDWLEVSFLPRHFPFFSVSLMVLCQIPMGVRE